MNPIALSRLILAMLLPLVAFALQSIFWTAIKPFAWFLFFPAVFFSSWIGGLCGGVIATLISTTLVWWAFIPPEYSFALEDPFQLGSIGLFMGMGVLFGYTQKRIKKANRKTAEALAVARSANEQLQGANEKITQLYEKTLELDQLKNQLFANVSHELRTPLALILGPVAKRLAAGDLGDEERRDLEVVDRSARLLYRHVSDLLDVAKLEAGRMHMQYARVDLAHLAGFVASHFEVLARERRIRYTVDTRDATPAQVDAEKFQRILLNILSNAFKFTPDGGAIALTLDTAGGRAVIRVQDNGPGVPAAMRQTVFDRFRQVEGGAERRFGGTGLGLAIVREFVELHGGSVAVEEAPGGGALFTVALPQVAPEGTEILATPSTLDEAIDRQALDELRTQHSAAMLPPPVLAANAPLVLVVEDNPDMNAFVAEALGRHYRVVTAFDGQEGLHKAFETRPDLIVSDVMMPRMSGDQMVGALRRRREFDDVPIVLLTAKADDELRVKLLKEGVQDYVYKPFSVEELLARVGGLISERKRREASLREAYGLLHAVTESIPDTVFVKDSTGRYLMINAAGVQLLGRPVEQVLGKRDSDFLPPEAARKVMEEDREVMAKGESRTLEETVMRAGIACTFLSTEAPLRNPQGEITGVLGIRRDITERKRAEEAIRRLNEQLEHRVLQRTAELEEQYRRVQEANRLKSEFLANMSHELRTPLNGIIGFAELMHDGKVGPVSAQHKEYLGDILTSSRHLLQLINDVLDLAKVESGKMEFRSEPVDLAKLVSEVRDILRTLAAKKRIRIDAEVDATLIGVVIDPAKFKQILYNYLSNALKFTPDEGRVTVRVGPAEAGTFCLEVEDSGIGIRPEDMGRLFVEFQQIDASAAKKYQGTGLGLALTRRIVEAQGGQVGVRSTPGQGSVFFAVLPRVGRTVLEAEAQPAPAPAAAPRVGAPTLLVIEDDPKDRAWLERTLRGAGYAVESAATGTAALARCRERRFDAITLDLLLPDGSGWDVLRELRAGGLNQEVPVIVVTVVAEAGAGVGFPIHDFLTKPVEAGELLSSLERAGVRPDGTSLVLVVDDDPNALKLMEATLGQLGYRPLCAADGESGLRAARETAPAAVVLDLLMPGMDGFEFLDRLRRTATGRRTPVIVWTVKDLTPGEREQLRTSAQAVVLKSAGGIAPLLQELQAYLPHPRSEGRDGR